MTVFKAQTAGMLLDYLAGRGYSRTKIKQLVKYRAVAVDGTVAARLDHPVAAGSTVAIGRGKSSAAAAPPLGISVVYEDNAVMVVEKPAGLLTIASEKEKIRNVYYQLNNFLRQHPTNARERVFIVHRLDRDTSGLLVFARSEAAKRALQGGWKTAEKRYCAVVEGTPAKSEGAIESHLSETKSLKVYSGRETARTKFARTRYRVLQSGRRYSLLEIVLETGRKNQIRVHLADIGHPVAGDAKYGARTDPLKRLALHAHQMSFRHPVTGQELRFESTIPDGFSRLMLR